MRKKERKKYTRELRTNVEKQPQLVFGFFFITVCNELSSSLQGPRLMAAGSREATASAAGRKDESCGKRARKANAFTWSHSMRLASRLVRGGAGGGLREFV